MEAKTVIKRYKELKSREQNLKKVMQKAKERQRAKIKTQQRSR